MVPFDRHRPVEAMMVIMRGDRPPRPSHLTLTDELWELVQQCWNQDPRKRPPMPKVLQALRSRDPFEQLDIPSPHQRTAVRGAFAAFLRNPLGQLRRLDMSSSKFPDQLHNILHGGQYKKWVLNLQDDDLVGLVDYLDKVCYHISHLCSLLKPP